MDWRNKSFDIVEWGDPDKKIIGCIINGCPSEIQLVNKDLDDQLREDITYDTIVSPLPEYCSARILSGVRNGVTIGSPLSIAINKPGRYIYRKHISDQTCLIKLAAGCIARKILQKSGILIDSIVEELDGIRCDTDNNKARAVCLHLEKIRACKMVEGIILLKISSIDGSCLEPYLENGKIHILSTLTKISGIDRIEYFEETAQTEIRNAYFRIHASISNTLNYEEDSNSRSIYFDFIPRISPVIEAVTSIELMNLFWGEK